jgi:hypothetical protein
MNDQFEKLFNNFIKKASANKDDALRACLTLNLNPPSDYLAALYFTNGGEGFIQQSYFRLYSIEELLSFNEAYQVKRFAPGLVIFGSNGSGEAFGFDTRQDPIEIVQIPFIPMDFQYAKPLGKNFVGFLHALDEMDHDDGDSPQIEMSALGKEVHEIHPIVFGGNPTDEKNKALVPSEAHAKLSVFWNSVYQEKIQDEENK